MIPASVNLMLPELTHEFRKSCGEKIRDDVCVSIFLLSSIQDFQYLRKRQFDELGKTCLPGEFQRGYNNQLQEYVTDEHLKLATSRNTDWVGIYMQLLLASAQSTFGSIYHNKSKKVIVLIVLMHQMLPHRLIPLKWSVKAPQSNLLNL